jgi:DNA polymerase III delta subunit
LNSKALALFPFTVLMGDDTISREKARNEAFNAFADTHTEIVIDRFDHENQEFSSFYERIITPSLFPTIRFFHLQNAHILNKKDLALLSDVFKYDVADQYILIETERSQTKKSRDKPLPKDFLHWLENFSDLIKKQPKKFSISEFVLPPDYKMAQWLETRTPFLIGRAISKKDAEYFIDLVGADAVTLYSELQKIDIVLPPKKNIDQASIDMVSGSSRAMAPYELAQALGKKDFPKVLEIIDSLYRGSVHLPLLVSAIFKHFWGLFRIAMFAKAHPNEIKRFLDSMRHFNKSVQEEIGVMIGVSAGLMSENQKTSVYPVLVKGSLVQHSATYTEGQYKRIFKLLEKYDIGIKTGRESDAKTGLQLLCYKIYRVAELEE